MDAELEQIFYVASHHLQEPLRLVASYTQLLEQRYRGQLGADADEYIGYAVEGAIRMRRLINDLLTYSRVGTRGRLPVPTDSARVLEQALSGLRGILGESDAIITYDALPMIMADEMQLLQLFQNLVSNAIKFRREGIRTEVRISARRDGPMWVFSVYDNGIGMDPAYFERIFELFQRLHPRDEYPGTGLGLAICRKIVERHGGRIWVESEPERGSTFYFTFPAVPQ